MANAKLVKLVTSQMRSKDLVYQLHKPIKILIALIAGKYFHGMDNLANGAFLIPELRIIILFAELTNAQEIKLFK